MRKIYYLIEVLNGDTEYTIPVKTKETDEVEIITLAQINGLFEDEGDEDNCAVTEMDDYDISVWKSMTTDIDD